MRKTDPWRWRTLVDLPDVVSWTASALDWAPLSRAVKGWFGAAFALLFVSAVADILDGAVARATGRARRSRLF